MAKATTVIALACAALASSASSADALKLAETFDDGALAGWTHSSAAKYTGARQRDATIAKRDARTRWTAASTRFDGGEDEG